MCTAATIQIVSSPEKSFVATDIPLLERVAGPGSSLWPLLGTWAIATETPLLGRVASAVLAMETSMEAGEGEGGLADGGITMVHIRLWKPSWSFNEKCIGEVVAKSSQDEVVAQSS